MAQVNLAILSVVFYKNKKRKTQFDHNFETRMLEIRQNSGPKQFIQLDLTKLSWT